jgi:hypothetical protein
MAAEMGVPYFHRDAVDWTRIRDAHRLCFSPKYLNLHHAVNHDESMPSCGRLSLGVNSSQVLQVTYLIRQGFEHGFLPDTGAFLADYSQAAAHRRSGRIGVLETWGLRQGFRAACLPTCSLASAKERAKHTLLPNRLRRSQSQRYRRLSPTRVVGNLQLVYQLQSRHQCVQVAACRLISSYGQRNTCKSDCQI